VLGIDSTNSDRLRLFVLRYHIILSMESYPQSHPQSHPQSTILSITQSNLQNELFGQINTMIRVNNDQCPVIPAYSFSLMIKDSFYAPKLEEIFGRDCFNTLVKVIYQFSFAGMASVNIPIFLFGKCCFNHDCVNCDALFNAYVECENKSAKPFQKENLANLKPKIRFSRPQTLVFNKLNEFFGRGKNNRTGIPANEFKGRLTPELSGIIGTKTFDIVKKIVELLIACNKGSVVLCPAKIGGCCVQDPDDPSKKCAFCTRLIKQCYFCNENSDVTFTETDEDAWWEIREDYDFTQVVISNDQKAYINKKSTGLEYQYGCYVPCETLETMPTSVSFCKDGITCPFILSGKNDGGCIFSHTADQIAEANRLAPETPCPFGIRCNYILKKNTNTKCPYLHTGDMITEAKRLAIEKKRSTCCPYGPECYHILKDDVDVKCGYFHDPDLIAEAKYLAIETAQNLPCPYGIECIYLLDEDADEICGHIHDEDTINMARESIEIPNCRYGINCYNEECSFGHPPEWNPNRNRNSTKKSNKNSNQNRNQNSNQNRNQNSNRNRNQNSNQNRNQNSNQNRNQNSNQNRDQNSNQNRDQNSNQNSGSIQNPGPNRNPNRSNGPTRMVNTSQFPEL